jgi:hypothetical protein
VPHATLRPTPPEEETTEAADREITVTDLKAKLDRSEPFTIIDVRDPHERGVAGQTPSRHLLKSHSELDGAIHVDLATSTNPGYR